jgi:hypothetical protein
MTLFWKRIGFCIALLVPTLLGGCSDEEALTDPNKLCARGAGIAARISGTPHPIEMCVDNDETSAVYTLPPDDRYALRATSVSDSIEVTIEIGFRVYPDQPRNLTITTNATQAFVDPNGAWFFYRETKPGAYDYSASSVSGVFTLTFTDRTVAVGTFSDLKIELEETSGGAPAGSRVISEGFFAVTPD